MKKVLLLTALLVLLTPFVVSAADCETGYHWVEEDTIIAGHYENGDCNSWSTPTCNNSEWVCSLWGPFHILCWDWDYVCTSYTEPICNGYEQIWVDEQTIPGGTCVEDEAVEPEEEVIVAGHNYMYLLPKIQDYMTSTKVSGNQVTFSWLNSKFMYGKVLVSSKPVGIALNEYGRLFSGKELEIIKPDKLMGYEKAFYTSGAWSYQTVKMNLGKGTWYLRPVSWLSDETFDYTVGQETSVTIY